MKAVAVKALLNNTAGINAKMKEELAIAGKYANEDRMNTLIRMAQNGLSTDALFVLKKALKRQYPDEQFNLLVQLLEEGIAFDVVNEIRRAMKRKVSSELLADLVECARGGLDKEALWNILFGIYLGDTEEKTALLVKCAKLHVQGNELGCISKAFDYKVPQSDIEDMIYIATHPHQAWVLFDVRQAIDRRASYKEIHKIIQELKAHPVGRFRILNWNI